MDTIDPISQDYRQRLTETSIPTNAMHWNRSGHQLHKEETCGEKAQAHIFTPVEKPRKLSPDTSQLQL
eukprot:CAMPEP_0115554746 /NCGR_PEP_ID=MMETSP0271-20121206/97454_1 /TAXON_ID=71861 /ORGANISM="Scrippsiella trochoidea, Strain CCMP3099" /LENGTH=67 /DNA_ID=CAMNT_0002988485 /DNA_START=52 /DNA_END=255 /DNA_ORIENTATION=+